jgi:hypothetical protein
MSGGGTASQWPTRMPASVGRTLVSFICVLNFSIAAFASGCPALIFASILRLTETRPALFPMPLRSRSEPQNELIGSAPLSSHRTVGSPHRDVAAVADGMLCQP